MPHPFSSWPLVALLKQREESKKGLKRERERERERERVG
jgi:hypothetical protein